MKIILHFGFPKTGSSTLQFGLFKPLEEKGLLNLKTWRQFDPVEHHDRRPSSCLFNGQKILDEYLDFDEGKLNILSDESFTAPIKLRQNNYGKNIIDPFSFPSTIKQQIEEKYGTDIEFIPVISIRNQSDLLYSQYVEEYNLKKYKNVDLLFDEQGIIDLTGFEIYQFGKYFETLERVFGPGKTKLFLFQDWKQDYSGFCARLAELINVEEKTVEQYLSSNHVNKKEKSSEGYYTKDGATLIPFLTVQQKQEILSFFKEDNLLLQKILGSEINLKEYGFFN
ncbi:hypothetical protein Ssed_2999 [Shewanella sediminis HAW-EB3]|uniref:Sulfotransferase domain-containing protein n=1 Tax=Shewanella sediminis (strain HAW-EB3) TaxID=425104 RepID=A8FXN0_SHESH|nr:hypothetical protein [Shewanella sediminis]ABV37603.1 hypothetical protein Ssed_2999 [Shewanella sediminis HAW-EB3]